MGLSLATGRKFFFSPPYIRPHKQVMILVILLNTYKTVVGKQGKKVLEVSRHRWEKNIKEEL